MVGRVCAARGLAGCVGIQASPHRFTPALLALEMLIYLQVGPRSLFGNFYVSGSYLIYGEQEYFVPLWVK